MAFSLLDDPFTVLAADFGLRVTLQHLVNGRLKIKSNTLFSRLVGFNELDQNDNKCILHLLGQQWSVCVCVSVCNPLYLYSRNVVKFS